MMGHRLSHSSGTIDVARAVRLDTIHDSRHRDTPATRPSKQAIQTKVSIPFTKPIPNEADLETRIGHADHMPFLMHIVVWVFTSISGRALGIPFFDLFFNDTGPVLPRSACK
jgi:hypothetical protein